MSEQQPIADQRAWGALALCLLAAILLTWWLPVLGWFFGALFAYVVLRGVANVLVGKAAMADPEEKLHKSSGS